MVVIVPRTNSSSYDDATPSPRVASHTMVGMVLGVLCLFGIVLAYQFLPRKSKPNPRTMLFATPTNSPPPSFLQRLRTHCITFLRRLKPKGSAPKPEEPARTPRSLRTLYLSPESRQRNRERARELFATTHRLKLSIPHMRNPFTPPHSPHTPSRRLYTHLGDRDVTPRRPTRPAAAILSPWSPNEQEYPYADTGRVPLIHHYHHDEPATPVTPPPIDRPPRVYVPETPLRGDFVVDRENEWEKIGSDPFGDSKRDVETEALVRGLRQQQRELEKELRKEGVFVIGDDEEDWDSDSDTGSLYSIPSEAK